MSRSIFCVDLVGLLSLGRDGACQDVHPNDAIASAMFGRIVVVAAAGTTGYVCLSAVNRMTRLCLSNTIDDLEMLSLQFQSDPLIRIPLIPMHPISHAGMVT